MLCEIQGDPKNDAVCCVDGMLDDDGEEKRVGSHRIVEGEEMLTERLDNFFLEFPGELDRIGSAVIAPAFLFRTRTETTSAKPMLGG